jgi:glutathione synthase/RimK-type ligase-like ATP-grasp enzyme
LLIERANEGEKMNSTRAIAVITEISETNETNHFGSIHDFCIELAEYAERKGFLFYVTSLTIYTGNERLGYMWENNSWVKTLVPEAGCIYNRIHSRKTEHSPKFQEFLQHLQNNHIPIFNERYLNKWEVYHCLSNYEYLCPFLPETQMFTSKQTLEQFLNEYETVFIKPIHGSQGKKIFRIQKKEGHFLLDYSTFSVEKEQIYSSVSALFLALKERIKQPVIIQQGVPLQTYKNRPVDFRLLCHRVNDSKWQVTSSVARVASEESFVSNAARGGELFHINDMLKELYEPSTSTLQKNFLKELSLEIAAALSASTAGLYGEFGIDLALDTCGKSWVIEVNTKPSKNLDMPFSARRIRPSAKAIIDYCTYLINQKEEGFS